MSRDRNISFLSYAISDVAIGGRIGYMLPHCPSTLIRNPWRSLQFGTVECPAKGSLLQLFEAMVIFCKT
jgi:prolipoprotein diacylglyceryltransferase